MYSLVNNSSITIDTIENTIGSGAGQLETQLQNSLNKIATEPNPSAGELVQIQAQLQIWANMVQLQSSIYKVFNDALKQVVTNAAS